MRTLFPFLLLLASGSAARADDPPRLKLLFLGDNAGHKPAERFKLLQPAFAGRGIDLTYTDKLDDLNPATLGGYDGLVVYANHTSIAPEQEKALIDFVEGGKGFVALHCASFCFLNSPKYVSLVGAQFRSHGTGTFKTDVVKPDHEVVKDYRPFTSWDETYVHARHNERDRTVLEVRTDGDLKEPWTWVRTQGKGRVFYTAWGHDRRTWGNPGFQDLVERGVRWACGQDPAGVTRPGGPAPAATASHFDRPFPTPGMTAKRTDVRPFEYVDVGRKIPNYTPGRQWGVQGEPMTRMQRPLPADESQKHVVVPKGFRAEVYVTEKELGGKPICMAWDERGRLWAALTMDYPNELNPPEKGRDKIVVCEDTDGDGRGDKVTVFAEGLSIPTSLFFARGGVVAFDATQTVFLKDADGDGKADRREVLFGTWNQRDTHGGPSNMQYGLDNWVWAMQGYNDSRLTVGGEQHRFRQGFFRFKPDGSKLEFVRSTNNNTWGLGISEEGVVFGSTANGNPSEHMPIPNRYYEAVKGWAPSLVLRGMADSNKFQPVTDRVRQVDYHGGYTAAAGHALYTARAYPQEYWNRTAFVAEPTGHLVAAFVIRRDGSGFRSSNPFNLFASDDEWAAPIMAEVGPDGNVWVLDWYNFIVQHNPTPQGFQTGKGAAYESDLRDKTHGRIYRVIHEANGSAKDTGVRSSLAGATPEKLVAVLAHDNLFWRRHAQRLLVERGNKDVVPALIALARDQKVDPIGLNVGAIHALWTLHGLGALDGSNPEVTAAAVSALNHPSAGVRRNAVQVLPRTDRTVDAILAAGLVRDPDMQVRLMTLLALADQPPTATAGAAVFEALGRPENVTDRWIPDAVTCAAAANGEHFLRAVAGAKQPGERLLGVVAVVAEHYARGGPVDSAGAVVAGLAEADPAVADAAVRGLAKGWPAKTAPKLDAATEDALGRLTARVAPERRALAVRLAAAWGSKQAANFGAEVAKTLAARVNDPAAKVEDRVAAASELVGYQAADKELVRRLLDVVTPQAPPELGVGILRAVQASEAAAAGGLIADRLPGMTPTVRSAGIGVLLSRAEWARALVSAVEAGKVHHSDLSLEQRQALADHPDPGVRRTALAALRRGGVLPSADRQKVIEELIGVVKEKGDPKAGKAVFAAQCAKCHTHSGEGTAIGPDLTGMAVHPKEELLVHVLDPSRSVEGNFRVYTAKLLDGRVVQGMLASESRTAVEMVDAEGKRHSVLREDIESLSGSARSLMPEGFEKQATRKDLTDLLEFLTRKGKYLPLPLDKVATVVSTTDMFSDRGGAAERLVFPDWKPKAHNGVPFVLVDPQGDRVKNAVMLYGPNGVVPPKMPKAVTLPVNGRAKAVHLLGGVGGWSAREPRPDGPVSLTVRLHYDDGKTEDHPLRDGVHLADYSRRVDVPGSAFAFDLGGQQVRYLAVTPKRPDAVVNSVELVKGTDGSAPVVLAVTVEAPE